MGKRSVFTNITPLPSNIPRQLVVDMLHNHGEIISLNPLVIEHHPVQAPKKAAADEYFSNWYEITERIEYLPGIGKMGSGKVAFKGVFHDVPYGLQTHVYVPLGIDIRNKWSVRGNQPGEPPEVRELGDAVPREGLYIREDVDLNCNIMLTGFVKKSLKDATSILVQRLVKKAELLDAGDLQAMFENGRLTTINPLSSNKPNIQNSPNPNQGLSNHLSLRDSYRRSMLPPTSPNTQQQGFESGNSDAQYRQQQPQYQGPNQTFYSELPGSGVVQQSAQRSPYLQPSQQFAMELPGSVPVRYNSNAGLGISSDTSSQYGHAPSPSLQSTQTSQSGRQFSHELE